MINNLSNIQKTLKQDFNKNEWKKKISSLNFNSYIFHYNNFLLKQYKQYNREKIKNEKKVYKNKNFLSKNHLEEEKKNKLINQNFIICKSIKLNKNQSNGKIRKKIILKKKKNKILNLVKKLSISSLSQIVQNDTSKLKYCIKKGNNHNLIKEIMKTKKEWLKSSSEIKNCSLIWSFKLPEISIKYMDKHRILYNHFEFNKELTQKDNLYLNVKNYCEEKKLNFDFLPLTYVFDMSKSNFQSEINKFSKIFRYYQLKNKYEKYNETKKKRKINTNPKQIFDILSNYKFKFDFSNLPQIKYDKNIDKVGFSNKYDLEPKDLNKNLNNGYNFWLLKPTSFNRGFGVEIFTSLDELNSLIQNYLKGYNDKFQSFKNKNMQIMSRNKIKIKSHKFVIQKYIEKPLLINERKFDIRIFAMIDQTMKPFLFKKGYIRTSSNKFNCDNKEKFVHLTNDAIQILNKKYGKFEDGNKLSFSQFEKYVKDNYNNNYNFNNTWEKIIEIIKISINSTIKKINKNKLKNCFEIFGYDFMIDEDFNIFLIEINENPCLQLTSSLLKEYVPEMVNDVLNRNLNLYFNSDYEFNKNNNWVNL